MVQKNRVRKKPEAAPRQKQSKERKDVAQAPVQRDVASLLRQAEVDPDHLAPQDVMQLQRVIGNHAVDNLVGHGQNEAIQRLPTAAAFKDSTALHVFARRNKVKPIDDLVKEFHELGAQAFVARFNKIGAIVDACDTYLAKDPEKAKRQAGVQVMRNQAATERPIYAKLAEMENAGTLYEKYNAAIEAQDLSIEAERAGNTELSASASVISPIINTIVGDIQQNEPATMQRIAQDDYNRLMDMLNDPTLPDITRSILNELAMHANEIGIMGTAGGPGARLANAGDTHGKKYTVNHGLNQNLGTTERIGSLAHEMTHVASGESFDNTGSFLMYSKALSQQELNTLGQKRAQEVQALNALLQTDDTFDSKQKALLQDKINYGFEDKLLLYAARFDDAGIARLKDDPNDAKGLKYRQDAQAMMAAAQAAPGQSSVFIEYDTVMNQMLIYLHKWGIPTNNPFYAKLRQVAEDAYDARVEGFLDQLVQQIQNL